MSTRRDSTPLYEGIRSLVLSARQNAARGIDLLQVYTNFEIGRRIVEQEQRGEDRAGYVNDTLPSQFPSWLRCSALANARYTKWRQRTGYRTSRLVPL